MIFQSNKNIVLFILSNSFSHFIVHLFLFHGFPLKIFDHLNVRQPVKLYSIVDLVLEVHLQLIRDIRMWAENPRIFTQLNQIGF
jgi:hypothetical protein